MIDSVVGGAAGGTIDTIVQYLEMGTPNQYILKYREKKGDLTIEPFYGLGYNRVANVWTFPYVMAPINTKVVESTNKTLGHTSNLQYNEAMVVPSLISDILISLLAIIGASLFFFYP